MSKCILCSKCGSDDSKDSISIHKVCWYSWVLVTHEGDPEEAVKSLHELKDKINAISLRSQSHHKHLDL